jgi:hypothetical protein
MNPTLPRDYLARMAQRHLRAERRAVQNTVAPILRVQYLQAALQLQPAVDAVLTVATEVAEVERVARGVQLTTARRFAPARSPLPPGSVLGERLVATLAPFATWLQKHLQALRAAA